MMNSVSHLTNLLKRNNFSNISNRKYTSLTNLNPSPYKSFQVSVNKKLIIGIGNYFYPQSRHSIGFFILDKLVELKQLNWTFYQNERFWATEFENFILLKPQTYLIEDNRKPILTALQKFKLGGDDITIICHDFNLPFANFEVSLLGKSEGNSALEVVSGLLQTNRFRRILIGIGGSEEELGYHPSNKVDSLLKDHYAHNRFNDEQLQILQTSLFSPQQLEKLATTIFNLN